MGKTPLTPLALFLLGFRGEVKSSLRLFLFGRCIHTLEELFTVLKAASLGVHRHPRDGSFIQSTLRSLKHKWMWGTNNKDVKAKTKAATG
ncbi:hypothetical protein SAMN02745166_02223 [Prosthecobacter debontii]|uniref:Uncharacterized protein n=1 Tax=Prosthecobacter debontii TaxID=48467 RepID=A0A1T4Y0P8_9BACT|nr:hypothetical protein SAMN02745166_02223 [Prosthecobacter debontii]